MRCAGTFALRLTAQTRLFPSLQHASTASPDEGVTGRQLVMEVMSKLEGAYGLLVKSAHYAGELVACKRGSPLIMGIREPGVQRPRLAGTRPAYAPVRMRLFVCQRLASLPWKGGMMCKRVVCGL